MRRTHPVAAALLACVLAAGCTRDAAPEPGRSDAAAARALFDRALVAGLEGDALAADDLMFEVAARHPDTPHGRAARARISGTGIGIAGAGILAAVAIPAFMKYQRRSNTSEAVINVRRMYDAAVSFYAAEHTDRAGKRLPPRFPQTTSPTPQRPFCEDGDDGFVHDPDVWNQPGWQELNFAIDGPHRYQYQFISEGTGAGAMFTARALGDLNCDGVLSTFERVGAIDAEGNVTGGAGLYTANELE